MDVSTVSTAVGSLGVGGVLGALINSRLTTKREDRNDRRDQTRSAATELREALANVRTVIDASAPTGLVSARSVVEAMTSWGKTYERWRAWLPENARHIDASVSNAVSTHFGVVGRAHHLPEYASEDIADNLDHEWQEKASLFVSHVIRWLDEARRDGHWTGTPFDFDEWLKAYAEHQEAMRRGEFTRFDRILNRMFGAGDPPTVGGRT